MSHTMPKGIKVLFIAGFGPVVRNQQASEKLFKGILQLPLESIEGYDGYMHSRRIEGAKYFAVWPLDKAALACFDTPDWPEDMLVPQAWLEMEVDDLELATNILEQNGYEILSRLREEPWGQTVTRFLSPEGILMAVTYTPFLRETATG